MQVKLFRFYDRNAAQRPQRHVVALEQFFDLRFPLSTVVQTGGNVSPERRVAA